MSLLKSTSEKKPAKPSLLDLIYKYFERYGKKILEIYITLPDDIRKSGIHLYPEVYASLIAFLTFISILFTIILSIILFIVKAYVVIPIIVLLPFATFLIMVHLPKLIGSSRSGGIEGELPFMTSYLSMMVVSGLSPYVAFERIAQSSRIFTKSSELAQRFILLVRIMGKDPLTAFSTIAQRTPSASVRDLLMGYITTVRSGGDVKNYLITKARIMFSEILVKMKIAADRLGGLLEAYLAIVLLTLISFTIMYFITVTYASFFAFGLTPISMFLFLYILLPFISAMIIYLADLIQYKEPWIDWRPYQFFFGLTIPLIIFLSIFGILLYYLNTPPELAESILVKGLNTVLTFPTKIMNTPDYINPSIGLGFVLIYATIPTVIFTEMVMREHKIIMGITRFLRDLVEIRKTGLSPERSIIELSTRSYGVFTKYLKKMALQLSLGVPLRRIIDDLFKKILVWRAKVLLYVMTDTIEVGGGTIEVMENLAWFAESVESIEEEHKKTLRTLLIVPYIGGILSAATIVMLTAFMGTLQFQPGAYKSAAMLTLPSIVLNVYIMGLVAGKVSGSSVASGFKHAVFLTAITIVFLTIAPLMESFIKGIVQPLT